MASKLTSGKTLWSLFAVFAALSLAMLAWIIHFDLHIIDEIWNPEQVETTLAAQSSAQHRAHFWMTLILDIPYPFVYGPLFAGLVLKYFKGGAKWLSVPAFLTIPTDTIENVSQLYILGGNMAPLGIKAIVTPIKLTSFILAVILALLALFIAFRQRSHSH